MAAIILGKNLLCDDELIEFAFSDQNNRQHNLVMLQKLASDAALHSSLILIRMMKADRIFIETRKSPTERSTKHS